MSATTDSIVIASPAHPGVAIHVESQKDCFVTRACGRLAMTEEGRSQ